MSTHNFLRVAAASPELRVADPAYNAVHTLQLLDRASDDGAELVVFPEMGLTGYTCHDLFHHPQLIRAAEAELGDILENCSFQGIAVIGLPVALDGMLFNAAAVFARGDLLGVVPKSHLPNYKEFYDGRYFHPAAHAVSKQIELAGRTVPFGTDLLFACKNLPGFVLGVEICEDLWVPVPPSSLQAIAGATVFVNLSASNEVIGKASYRRELVANQSGRCLGGYVYASSGPSESTTDLVFGGHCMIAENGGILKESKRFVRTGHLTAADLDLDRFARDRITATTFANRELTRQFRRIPFEIELTGKAPLLRFVDPHPFVPKDPGTLRERCEEIFATQVCGLSKRLEHIGKPPVAIGVSGGLDSTLALLVVAKTFDLLQEPHSKIHALTMPGFGTTERTLGNARLLMHALGATAKEIDIRPLCLQEMQALGHTPFGIPLAGHTVESFSLGLKKLTKAQNSDLAFENVQARVRTSLLMNTGFTIGTGDVSELALGWCTYNADHMSMYNPNVSIPKTLVKFLVRWAAENEFEGEARATLQDITNTEISPELLPVGDGNAPQSTEASVGPYELVDFFLYHFLRWGCPPEKILFLASQAAFDKPYTGAEIQQWLKRFLTRFFANQFKRSCIPDGPKVGTVSVSPRGDWRMPSDASAKAWLDGL